MSAKLTIIFFILICFEIGVLLVYLPWHRSWDENHLLILAADRLHWGWLIHVMISGYMRGAVTGLGLLNLMLGTWEIRNFKKNVQAFQSGWHEETSAAKLDTAGVPDNRPAAVAVERPGDGH
jgi:hypothetical protein